MLWSSKMINYRINTHDRLVSFGALKTEWYLFNGINFIRIKSGVSETLRNIF